MPDDVVGLVAQLLELARSQSRCLDAEDWDGFTRLAEARQSLTDRLMPLVAGHPHVRETLLAIAALDARHAERLAQARDGVAQELGTQQPKRTAVMAYYQGERDVRPEAQFIDRRD